MGEEGGRVELELEIVLQEGAEMLLSEAGMLVDEACAFLYV